MKRKPDAFTIIKVLIATAVLASSVFVLSRLQFNSWLKVNLSTQTVERVFFVKKYLYQLLLAPPTKDKPEKVSLDKPELHIKTSKREIDPKKSSLKEFAQEIDIIQSQGTWGEEQGTNKKTINMISFVLKQAPGEES